MIDTAQDTVKRHVTDRWRNERPLAWSYSPDGTYLLVVSSAENSVNVLNARDHDATQQTLKTGKTPFGIAFTADARTRAHRQSWRRHRRRTGPAHAENREELQGGHGHRDPFVLLIIRTPRCDLSVFESESAPQQVAFFMTRICIFKARISLITLKKCGIASGQQTPATSRLRRCRSTVRS